MNQTEDVGIHRKHVVVIVLISDWAKYDASTLSISSNRIENVEYDKEDSGSFPEMRIDDTTLASDDSYTEV